MQKSYNLTINRKLLLVIGILFLTYFITSIFSESIFINSIGNTTTNRILVPKGYARISPTTNSFAEYLQNLPIKKDGSNVFLFNGDLKNRQDVHVAVIDIDVGKRDLQQCADAVMRLRAEYLYKQKEFQQIHFNFTNGFNMDYSKYAQGNRLKIRGNSVSWKKQNSNIDYSYSTFKKYLEIVFSYAGSASLSKELKKVKNISEIEVGDVFIQGGFPGHAVIVIDMAIAKQTGEKIFLLAQSYMPAQEIHILKNPNDGNLSPWYSNRIKKELITPEWTFHKTDLKRF